jgi:hypothetical protein
MNILLFLLNPAPPSHTVVNDGYGDKYQPEFGMRRGHRFLGGRKCVICSLVYPKNEVGVIDGKHYCYRKGHFKDAAHDKMIAESREGDNNGFDR